MTHAPNADDEDLVVDVADGVATLWLNRPQKRNAVTFDMWRAIASACAELANDNAVRLLVIRGVGEHFCAGADISGLGTGERGDYQRANEEADRAIADFPKPSIAIVTGSCVGGGVEIAVACDIRLAAQSSRFGITPARLGIVYPAPAVERVARLIGPAVTKQLLYTAELIDARRAQQIGLVNEVVDDDDLDGRADSIIDLIANRRSLLTQMASKEMVDAWARDGRIGRELSRRWGREVAASSDPSEGVAAFIERREPHFTWVPADRDDSAR